MNDFTPRPPSPLTLESSPHEILERLRTVCPRPILARFFGLILSTLTRTIYEDETRGLVCWVNIAGLPAEDREAMLDRMRHRRQETELGVFEPLAVEDLLAMSTVFDLSMKPNLSPQERQAAIDRILAKYPLEPSSSTGSLTQSKEEQAAQP